MIRPEDFGALGDETTDDAGALQAACDSLGPCGGDMLLEGRYLIDSPLSVPDHVRLVAAGPGLSQFMYMPLAGAGLTINPTVTVSLGHGAALEGLTIKRKGLVAPENNAAAFAGTAITAAGNGNRLHRCGIYGFAKLYYSNGFGRHHLIENNGDGLNGFDIRGSLDTAIIANNHLWPFCTVYANPATRIETPDINHYLRRSGYAMQFHGNRDWTKVTGNFAIGYQISYFINDCIYMEMQGNGADDVLAAAVPYSFGWYIAGGSDDINIDGWFVNGKDYGICQAVSASDLHMRVTNGQTLTLGHNALQIGKGSSTVTGNRFCGNAAGTGVWVGDAASVANAHDNVFEGFGKGIEAVPANANVASRFNQMIGVGTPHAGVSAGKILAY
jgi:hypothetical protein